jgi:adenine phosphoribosyltransferase
VLGTGFVPIRKPGKLPARTHAQEYQLEYGSDRLEIHVDAVPPGARILLVDDVLATGGTLQAALALARQQGAQVLGAAVLVELGFLHGRARWDDTLPLHAAVVY